MTPEFHHLLAVDRVPPSGLDRLVVASAAECAALATRMAIPAVQALSCRFRLTQQADRSILGAGRLTARVVRTCVVSLDDFETEIVEDFRVRFVPAERLQDDATDPDEIDPESDDEIPFEAGAIDLGEAAAEQLALALDPYPRKPGAVVPEEMPDAAASPFAALSRLRRPD